MTEKKKETLHGISEAPASLNFYGVTARGWNVQFTLRDFDENLLLDRFGVFVKALEDQFNVVPKAIGRQPDGNGGDVSQNTPVGGPELPADDPGWCKLHNVGMKHRENETGEWWSHKYGDGWCNGKEA